MAAEKLRESSIKGERVESLGLIGPTGRPEKSSLLRTLFQGKWRLQVLQELMKGPARLSQLRRVLPACSKKVLIDTLHGLAEIGWIVRTEYPARVRRVEYSLAARWAGELREVVEHVQTSEVEQSFSSGSQRLQGKPDESV